LTTMSLHTMSVILFKDSDGAQRPLGKLNAHERRKFVPARSFAPPFERW